MSTGELKTVYLKQGGSQADPCRSILVKADCAPMPPAHGHFPARPRAEKRAQLGQHLPLVAVAEYGLLSGVN